MLNHLTIAGRLVKDPELRRTGSGDAVCSFRIANDTNYKMKDGSGNEDYKTRFFNCVAWKGTGEFIAKHFTKGRMILIEAELDTNSWTDKDGNKRTDVEIKVSNAYFCDSKKAEDQQAAAPAEYAGAYGGYAPAQPAQGGYDPSDPHSGYVAPVQQPQNGGYSAPVYAPPAQPAPQMQQPQQPNNGRAGNAGWNGRSGGNGGYGNRSNGKFG